MAYPLHGDPPRNPVGSSPPLPTPGDIRNLETSPGPLRPEGDAGSSEWGMGADMAHVSGELPRDPAPAASAEPPFNQRRATYLLKNAADEIRNLRRANAQLAHKAEAYEVLERVIGLIPDRRDRVASADLAYVIDEFLATPSVAFPDGGANG